MPVPKPVSLAVRLAVGIDELWTDGQRRVVDGADFGGNGGGVDHAARMMLEAAQKLNSRPMHEDQMVQLGPHMRMP